MSRIIKALALGATASLALTACSSGSSDPSTSTGSTDGSSSSATAVERGGELRIGAVVDIGTWKAADADWGNTATYYMAVYDTLLRTAADNTIEPGLATEWSYNEDNTELTLELRDDVTFTDGSELTAELAAQNLLRFRDGASPNTANLASVQDATAADEDTLVLTLSKQDPALLTYLSQNAGLVAAASSFDAADAQTTPVGSGPYILDGAATTIGSSYKLTANPDYWDPEIQHYDSILINYYSDASALLNALRDQQVDIANLNTPSQIPDAEAAGYTINSIPVNWKGLIIADRTGQVNEALGDVRVRQAINYALDREGLLQGLESGYGEPTTQIFGKGTEAYLPELEDAYPYDPEKAKALLAEAGYPDGVTIVSPQTGFVPPSEPELIAGVLAESGINIEYEQAGESFIGDLLGGKWAMFGFGLNQEPIAWMTYLQSIDPGSAWNVYHQGDDTIAALAERLRAGGEDADAAAKEMNEYIVEQAWFAPFYRVLGFNVTAEGTSVTMKEGQAVPNLWDIVPA
ncbi:peptide ABC transporter substrate-binding protein [Tessaracoccus sp. MC1627]|uniref:ABC transporter substrate-binding protein n=1 Tax=Tessaracoccus sp. MC1627 TaxID=2760312 RepID=UPI0016031B4C|nr:ABC transporter substrate-binding protein [Tessaracoccus sp. MC1627]MBB1513336.1 peptide ABC transporter substrate-binding protein [Tessaracoccus sp. MC1627]